MIFEVVIKFYDTETIQHEYYIMFDKAKQVFLDCIKYDSVKSVVVVSYFKNSSTVVLFFSNDPNDYVINFPFWVDN